MNTWKWNKHGWWETWNNDRCYYQENNSKYDRKITCPYCKEVCLSYELWNNVFSTEIPKDSIHNRWVVRCPECSYLVKTLSAMEDFGKE